MRIVFMGTPDFAVKSLEILVENGFQVVGVITAPDKPAGRGQQLRYSAVKTYAESKGLKVLQPTNLKHPDFLKELSGLKADLQVVVAFRMLPEVVWSMPPKGTFNLHASLLPQYRGAAPINWAIINGETKTGVTTFFIEHEIDTGDLLFQEEVLIEPTENAGSLHDKLMNAGAQLVLKTVQAIEHNQIHPIPQKSDTPIQHAPKIFKENCLIQWNLDAMHIYNTIRGLSPYPAAYTYLGDKILKIFEATVQLHPVEHPVGSFETDYKTYLKFFASNGSLVIKVLQLEGKRKMNIEEFLRGMNSLKF
jgi:methionyl-tRNA formyltransferase